MTVRRALSVVCVTRGRESQKGVQGSAGEAEMIQGTRANPGTSSCSKRGKVGTNCWESASLVNKGTSTQGPQWSGGAVHGVICNDGVEVSASSVVQRLFRTGSKPMCPSAPIHKTTLPAPMGTRRHKATQRAMREDRSPFIGGTRACVGKSDSLQGRNAG
jgi:hypothetical protein